MSLAFLTPSGPVAFSPLHHRLEDAGATFEDRAGWRVAVRVATPEDEVRALAETVGWADLSHRGVRTPDGIDLTTQFCAVAVGGPLARETIARFCALDLRHAGPGDVLPGSVARTPGSIEVLSAERFLLQAGAAVAEYLWDVVADAASNLGGRVVGADAFAEAIDA